MGLTSEQATELSTILTNTADIATIYNSKYTEGYNTGYTAGYNSLSSNISVNASLKYSGARSDTISFSATRSGLAMIVGFAASSADVDDTFTIAVAASGSAKNCHVIEIDSSGWLDNPSSVSTHCLMFYSVFTINAVSDYVAATITTAKTNCKNGASLIYLS